jgi:hypothetical protein
MKLRCLVIALAFLAAFASDSRGQSQEIPPQIKTEQKANETPAGKSATKNQDGKIEVAPIATPSPSADHGDDKITTENNRNSQETREGTEYWAYHGYKVKITDGLLVLFTFGLVIIGTLQAVFLSGTLTATATAANAAASSAEAQIAVEGGRLICQPGNCSYWNEVGQYADRWPKSPEMRLDRTFDVCFVLKNYGKTPATIREVVAVVTKSPIEPSNIFIKVPLLDLPSETTIGAGCSSGEFKVKFSQFFMLAEAIEVMDGNQNLWFYGHVVYDDVFGREGEQTFQYGVKPRGGFTLYWDQTTHRKKKN